MSSVQFFLAMGTLRLSTLKCIDLLRTSTLDFKIRGVERNELRLESICGICVIFGSHFLVVRPALASAGQNLSAGERVK